MYGGVADGAATAVKGGESLKLPGTVYAPGPGLLSRANVEPPFDALRDAVSGLGHNYLEKDPGGVSPADGAVHRA